MSTMTSTGNLSARLRIAQGRRLDDVVEIPEKPATPLEEPKQWHGEGNQCGWSVMAGQRCNRVAAAGGSLCRNHLAMMGTPAPR